MHEYCTRKLHTCTNPTTSPPKTLMNWLILDWLYGHPSWGDPAVHRTPRARSTPSTVSLTSSHPMVCDCVDIVDNCSTNGLSAPLICCTSGRRHPEDNKSVLLVKNLFQIFLVAFASSCLWIRMPTWCSWCLIPEIYFIHDIQKL